MNSGVDILAVDTKRAMLKTGMRAKKNDKAPKNRISASKLIRLAMPMPIINATKRLAHAPYSFETGGLVMDGVLRTVNKRRQAMDADVLFLAVSLAFQQHHIF